MVEQDTLVTPFESWHGALLLLADALDSKRSPDERSDIRGGPSPHIAALMRATR